MSKNAKLVCDRSTPPQLDHPHREKRVPAVFRPTFECGDGPRLEIEAGVAAKPKISTKLNLVQQQQLSEAFNDTREFRKYIMGGYNSCAVTKAQYSHYTADFQALDRLAGEIDELSEKPTLSKEETTKLVGLISQYRGPSP